MKIRMKVAISGARDGKEWPGIGGEVTVPDAEGADLCSQGHAEPVADVKVEKAVPPTPEKRGSRAGNNAG